MEMQQVRYFLALAKELNFTRAAEACNVTQPALTRAIKGLEEEFGGPLFSRERRNSHLTELGRTILPYVETIQAQSQAAIEKSRAYNSLDGVELKLGVMCTIGPSALSGLICGFQRAFPGASMDIRDGSQRGVFDKLTRGEIEIGILNTSNLPTDGMQAISLYSERFVIVLPVGHPLAEREVVRVQDLRALPSVDRTGCEVHDNVVKIFRDQDVDFRSVFSSRRDNWIFDMIRAGMGFGFLPEYDTQVEGVEVRPLVEPALERVVSLVTMRGRPHSPAVGALIELARTYDWPVGHDGARDWIVRV
jgi:DNA-binding transcriptional LysR family regulator